jgi:hypothetical protein
MTKSSISKSLFGTSAWLAAATILLAAAGGAEAGGGGSRATQGHAIASTPGPASNNKASTYLGCWGNGRCAAKPPSSAPLRPTITNGPAKNTCMSHGWHNRC